MIPTDAQDRKVTWKSSNEDFATVDEYGVVTYGSLPEDQQSVTVTITAAIYGGISRDFVLTVTFDPLPIAKAIRPLKDEVELTVGQQFGFMVMTDPDPAVIDRYEYVSDDDKIVSVDENGIMTAQAVGETTVRVRAIVYDEGVENVLTAEIRVVVTERKPEPKPAIDPTALLGIGAGCVIIGAAVWFISRKKKSE